MHTQQQWQSDGIWVKFLLQTCLDWLALGSVFFIVKYRKHQDTKRKKHIANTHVPILSSYDAVSPSVPFYKEIIHSNWADSLCMHPSSSRHNPYCEYNADHSHACTPIHTHYHVLQVFKLYPNGNQMYESFPNLLCLVKLCFWYLYMLIYQFKGQLVITPWAKSRPLPAL